MSKSTPSLLALLGLVAVAGYQNRGRISEMIADTVQTNRVVPGGTTQFDNRPETGGFLSHIGNMFGADNAGHTLSSGLRDLVDRFKNSGRGASAETWVSSEANMPINVDEMEGAIGHETLDELSRKTGLSRAELLLRLNAALPEVVNRYTPQGRLPTEAEAHALS